VLQQVVYRQLIYLVTIQSAVTALVGARLRWQSPARNGDAAALTSEKAATGGAARTRYVMQQLRRSSYRDPLWARLCVWAGVLLIGLSGTVVGAAAFLNARYQSEVNQADLLGTAATYHNGVHRDGPLNVLLIGIDWRKGQSGMIRSDTVMVMHIPRSRDRGYLFSLPRDTLVDIPAFPDSDFAGGRDRLNASFAYGAGLDQDRARGGRLLAATLKQLIGIPGFDAAVLLDFYGFAAVVKAMGGLDMCVDVDTRSIQSGVLYRKGCGRLDATAALDYLRQRKTVAGGDYTRQRHQQQFIKAIAKEATAQDTLSNPVKLDRVVRAAGSALTVTTGPVGPTEFAFSLSGVAPDQITMIRTGGHHAHDASGRYLGEELDPVAYDLFRAVRDEQVDGFVAGHPELVGSDH
jgi:LCP family protein required for cell wall assembly